MISIVIICLGIQAAYYLLVFSRLAVYNERTKSGEEQKCSILICYKNESGNIDTTLPTILDQKFEELLMVDDMSSDQTLEKLKKYSTEQIKVISVSETSSGKKQALLKGILAAKNNSILLTDADCIPVSKNWAAHMSSYNSSFVLGYGPMNKVKGLVGVFSRFETYMTALQYLSYALLGIPYMGVGRNLKIDKSMVLEQIDRIQGKHLASGDDDLMINSLSTKENTEICIEPESFVYSDPKINIRTFLKQKSRHISTAPYYKPIHILLLSGFSVAQIIFYLALIFCLLAGTVSLKLGIGLLLLKWAIQQAINFKVMKKLKEDDLFWKFPVLDILFFVYLLIMPFYYLFHKNYSTWS